MRFTAFNLSRAVFFCREFSDDEASLDSATNPNVVMNEATVRALGFASPESAIGQTINWQRMPVSRKARDSDAALADQRRRSRFCLGWNAKEGWTDALLCRPTDVGSGRWQKASAAGRCSMSS